MAKLKVTLIHSVAHRRPDERKIVKSLGLGRINSSRTFKDTAAVRGALFKITHLVDIQLVK